MMRYNTFILFGAPGSGKGTQGKTLGTIPRYYHCACGDVFRSIDTRTKVGKAFLEYSSKGQLVPDDITVELWREAIDSAVEAHKFNLMRKLDIHNKAQLVTRAIQKKIVNLPFAM